MAAKSQVSISIGAQLSPGYKQAFSAADKQITDLGRAANGLSSRLGDIGGFRRQQNAVKQAGREWQDAKAKAAALRQEIEASGKASRSQEAALKRAEAAARRAGGVYSEARTKLADMSRELQRSGTNVNRLSSEYRRLQGELTRTRGRQTELERSLERQQRLVRGMATAWRGIQSTAGAVGGTVAGMAAGAAVLSRPVGRAMTYDEQLTYMADTAAGGDSIEARRAMKAQLETAVNNALKVGGGKREDAATALNTLIASGEFEASEASVLLSDVARTAFASGASSEDVANTAIAMKRFGIRDIGAGFDAVMRGGQLGGFELRDMAKMLPSQLALAKSAGYTGSDGLNEIIAANQVAMRTAGNQDEAGNNLINLLQKFSSREFQDSIAKAVKPQKGDAVTVDKKGNAELDWAGYLIQQRGQGKNAIEAFNSLLDRQLSGDSRYQTLQKRMGQAGSDQERRDILQSMAEVAEGSALGQILADRQALLGALAMRQGGEDLTRIRAGVANSAGTVAGSSEFVREQTWARAQDSKNALDAANQNTYNALSGPLGDVLKAATDLSQEFPRLTTAAYSAGLAIATMTAAAGVFGAYRFIGKGGAAAAGAAAAGAGRAAAGAAGAGAAASAAGSAASQAAGSAAAGAGAASRAAGVLKGAAGAAGRYAVPGGAILGTGIDVYSTATNDNLSASEKNAEYVGAAGGLGGTLAGAKAGAAVGAFGGPIGAAIGGIAGAVAGNMLGDALGDWLGRSIFGGDENDGNTEGQNEASTAASEAAESAAKASEAASQSLTAVQQRPNITNHNSYSITINAGQTSDPQELGIKFQRELERIERQRAAEQRSSYFSNPAY